MEGDFTIKLGDAEINCPGLTLGQVRRIALALPVAAGGNGEASFDAELEIILAALATARPDLTRDLLLNMKSGRQQMAAAVGAVLLAGEFAGKGEAKAGSASS